MSGRARRSWAPRPGAYGVSPSLLSSAPPSRITRWTVDASGHLAIYRPPCGVDGCRQPSMTWCRCRSCRKVIGRCHEHEPAAPIAAARAACCGGP